ncbi:MAG TPA: hypothetical protein VF927_06820 [Solirubrobacteraceae bacterium]
MSRRQRGSAARRLEARFWTGPVGHLLGGGMDVLGALARASWRRLRSR